MSSQPNQSLIDGIRCFQELTASEAPLGNKELAERLNINVVKVNRLLRTLKSIGMAEQNSQKKYMPGPAVHLLAAQSFHSSTLFQAATRIAIKTNYADRTLAIGVLWKDMVVYMYHATANQSPAEGLGGYHIYHVSQSSIGQVLLADLDDSEIELRIEHWEQAQKDQIIQQIQDIRSSGYVCHLNENQSVINIAKTFTMEGATAGIAFTDFEVQEAGHHEYVAQLQDLIDEISTNPEH
ncbi:helix-turn-helix domain-containing protein [Vibrio penaeicida]|uniref:helix-turn-helix domain-containing protein n=1 Tax=Vibrio penaeicida TaxID=104609 RepID=UPI000CE9C020|nr:helix-turn-helix domain-containing protein [Vibrio penaeicida]